MLYVWNISWNDEGDREFIHFMDVPRLPISKVEKVFETKGKKLGSNTWVARRGWGQLLNCRMYTYISEKGTQVVLQSAFFLFHWISYQFLFILHKTSSSPLKIEGWKMEFDRLCSGSIYIYICTCFFLFVLSILPRESSKLMPRRELSREDFHALYSAELADAWCIPRGNS